MVRIHESRDHTFEFSGGLTLATDEIHEKPGTHTMRLARKVTILNQISKLNTRWNIFLMICILLEETQISGHSDGLDLKK